MKAVSKEVYDRIDNDLYNVVADQWWADDIALVLLQLSVNPLRVGYSKRMLLQELKIDPRGKTALEVGCGGGILTEEIAKMGFTTTGIDPSEGSLVTARGHAQQSGLDIRYDKGSGEALPYANASFDVVFCCDVLEHVRDLPKVVEEISRVLKPGGAFVFDTFNRTFLSKLVVIKIWQEWKYWAFMPPNLHVWDMFIKPAELRETLQEKGLAVRQLQGSKPSVSVPTLLGYLHKRAKGEWTYRQLGEKFLLVEDSDMNLLYLGLAVKE